MQYLIYSQLNRGLPQTHQPKYKHQSKGQGWGSADKKKSHCVYSVAPQETSEDGPCEPMEHVPAPAVCYHTKGFWWFGCL